MKVTAALTELQGSSMSVTFTDEEVETEARSLIRKRIQKSGWYPDLSSEERRRRIREDVDRHWHLMIDEATRRLSERSGQQ